MLRLLIVKTESKLGSRKRVLIKHLLTNQWTKIDERQMY